LVAVNMAMLPLDDDDFRTVDIDDLVDVRTVSIDPGQSEYDRILNFIWQVHNPYCFRVGPIAVKSSFTDSGPTLDDIMVGQLLKTVVI